MSRHAATLWLMLLPPLALAGEVDVIDVQPTENSHGSWRFRVTLRHADEGWAHYADRWEILDQDGKILATRVLAHPLVNEQPFTRGLSSVRIPPGTRSLRIRGHDKMHGYGGKELTLSWPPE